MAKRTIFIALIITAFISVCAFAEGTLQKVEAYSNSKVKFLLNGRQQIIPDGMTVLNYKDRIYVPVSYISNLFGVPIEWNEPANAVLLTEPTAPPVPTPTVPPTPTAKPFYQQLPIQLRRDELIVTITDQSKWDMWLDLKLEVTNLENNWLYYSEGEAYLDIDGKKVYSDKHNAINSDFGIAENQIQQSELQFDMKADYKYIKLVLPMYVEDRFGGNKESFDLTFYIDIADLY